jgi:hypothetical protein
MNQIIITKKQLELITNKVLNKNAMNENEDTSMDEYIEFDIRAVNCEGSRSDNGGSMKIESDDNGNPLVVIRYCKGDIKKLDYLKRKARREIEQSNQLPSDNESLFENKNMVKKIIRLTENDLKNIVTRVINEQSEEREFIKGVQQFLNTKGAKLVVDGKTGPNSKTEQAIMNYQSKIGVYPVDGVWGPDTWDKMPEKDKTLLKELIAKEGGLIDRFLNWIGL